MSIGLVLNSVQQLLNGLFKLIAIIMVHRFKRGHYS